MWSILAKDFTELSSSLTELNYNSAQVLFSKVPYVNIIMRQYNNNNYNKDTEWMLNPSSLKVSLGILSFQPDIDIFVSWRNHQFPQYW